MELEVIRGAAVSPGGFVCNLGATERTSVLPVQPGGDAELTEDVAAIKSHRRRVVVVTYWTRVAGR